MIIKAPPLQKGRPHEIPFRISLSLCDRIDPAGVGQPGIGGAAGSSSRAL